MIYLLTLILFANFIINFIVIKKDVIAPSILFGFPFLCSAICACFFDKIWKFENSLTGEIVSIGVIAFSIGAFLSLYILERTKNKNDKDEFLKKTKLNNLSKKRIIVYMLFEIALLCIEIMYIGKVFNFSDNILNLIGKFYSSKMKLATWINMFDILNFSATYIIIYILVCNNINKIKQNNNYLYICLVLSCIISLLKGNRTALIMYILAYVIMYVYLCKAKNENGKKDKKEIKKNIIKIAIAIIVTILIFILIPFIINRDTDSDSPIYNVATYLGAPLKNLEIFITKNIAQKTILGGATFEYAYDWLYEKTGKEFFNTNLNLYKYNWTKNGIGLGNVYTIFMPLLNDFGIIGCIGILFLLGFLFQYIYMNIEKKGKLDINIRLINYSYFAFALLFSFFSNKIFEMIFSISFVYFVIGIAIFYIYFFYEKRKKADEKN